MNFPLPHRLLVVAAAVVLGTVWSLPASACPFCGAQQGLTLAKETDQASMVLFGSLKNAKPGENFNDGTTELHIDAVIKDNQVLAGRKVIVLNRFVPADDKYKHLVFCDVFKGKIDPYQGRPLRADSDIVKYIDGALKLKDKDQPARLKYFFEYLDNADTEISNDAFKEFAYADYKDYSGMAKELSADRIASWLEDKKTPAFRFGLYGSMLGHCGKDKHAEVLRQILDNPDNPPASGVDGMLSGYVMLKPKEGYEYVCKMLKDGERDWATRYAALRSVRFMWEFRPDVLTKQQMVDGVCLMLDQGDICDLPIDDLRKWERWETADKVFALKDLSTHKAPIVQRAIIRYALCCPPGKTKAESLLAEMRQKTPKLVKEAEDLLKLENGK